MKRSLIHNTNVDSTLCTHRERIPFTVFIIPHLARCVNAQIAEMVDYLQTVFAGIAQKAFRFVIYLQKMLAFCADTCYNENNYAIERAVCAYGREGFTMLHGFKIAALCVTKIHEDNVRCFIDTFSEQLRPHGWRVFVYTSISDLYWKSRFDTGEKVIYDLIDFDVTDALLIMEDRIMDPEVVAKLRQRADEKSVPTFLVDGSSENCCSILFDYDKGFESVVRHLLDVHGVRDFHYISGYKDNTFSDTRRTTMERVLREYGITLTEDMVSYGDFWSEPARIATEQLIAEKRVARAIVCANDTMALAVCSTLTKHGYRIPEDVIVTGFDGLDVVRFSVPRITTCVCDFNSLGARAAEAVLLLDKGEPLPQHVYHTPELLLQTSCGCTPDAPVDGADFFNTLTNTFNRFRSEDEKLSEVIASIQSCHSNRELTERLHGRLFYNMCTIIKKECIDFTLNPQVMHTEDSFGEQLYVLSDTDVSNTFVGYEMHRSEIVPRLALKLGIGMPIVFIALHSFDIPMGYLSFHYNEVSKSNYLKINQLASALNSAIGGYRNTQYQLHLQTTIEDMYKFDTLTGLYNRNGFLRRYQQQMQQKCPEEQTLVLCDLDGLKYINDTYSHREGDNAIAVVGEALRLACAGGLCSRYGGDELVGVIFGPCDVDEIRRRMQESLDEYNRTSDKPYEVSTSIGIYTTKHIDFERMFAKADALMYEDKKRKPNRRGARVL